MKAVVVGEGDGRPLSWQEVPAPTPGEGEVLLRVAATALNRADLAQRAGNYPPPPGASETLGLEAAGTISEFGAGVEGWEVGDKACALLSGGGYAEKVVVPAPMLMPIPEGWNLEEAAGMPEVFFTAFLNLFLEGDLQTGESVLIHGGASGVGTAAVQLAREAGARVFVTAGTDEKTVRCLELGAELAVNYREEDFAERVEDYTNGEGVDVVLDMVGADYLARNLDLLKLNGRLVFISTLGGKEAQVDIRQLMSKRLTLKGSTLRARPLEEKVRIKEAFMARFWGALGAGRVKPVIDRTFPVGEVEAAHAYMRENKNIGKIILRVAN